jgi:hypothetical protein
MKRFGQVPAVTGGGRFEARRLVYLGLAVAVAVVVWGLTVSAGSEPSAIPELHAVPPEYEYDPGLLDPAYERVEIPEAGLALEVPVGWRQLGQEAAWSPTGSGEDRIAVSWFNLVPTSKAEAIVLPRRSHLVASTPIVLDWGMGRQYLVKRYGGGGVGQGVRAPILSVEIHTVVTLADGETQWAYDVHTVAPTEEELAAMRPVYDTVLRSLHLSTLPRD